ncbi:MAG: Flp family type IVb pilin [Parvularculaceae bacterium]
MTDSERKPSREQVRATSFLRAFASDEEGATAIEYALIGALIFLAIVVGMTAVSNELNSSFSETSSALKAI